MSIVALSTTIGSLGDEIGREVAHALSCEFADREIIAKAAERYGESLVNLAHVTEEKPTLWERFAHTQRRYLTAVEAIMFEMAERGKVVLSGRGATLLLAKLPHVLRVRITAPEHVRAQRIHQQQGLTLEAAVRFVAETDRERAGRIRFLYQVDWSDAVLYDLVINTERLSVDRGARLILSALEDRRFQAAPEDRQIVTDLRIAAAAAEALLLNPDTRACQLFPSSKAGHVILTGMVEHEAQRHAAEKTVATIPGVTEVLNEIAVIDRTRHPSI